MGASIGDSMSPEDRSKLTELAQSGALSDNERDAMDGYYSSRLGLTGDIEDDIMKLYDFYIERINDKSSPQSVRETIHEYIVLFNLRKIDGPEVVAHKIAMVGRKGDPLKKNLPYLIGCLRNVLEYGLSSTNSMVEKRLVSSFEAKYNMKLSPMGRQRLFTVAANHGTMEVLFTILENDINVEDLFLSEFEKALASGGT